MAFTREFLKGLGIEGDNLEKVMAEHGKAQTEATGLKQKVEDLTAQNTTLNSQIKERDSQLTSIKKSAGDNEELKGKIKELQNTNKKAAEEWQTKLAAQQKGFKIETALQSAKARNTKAVKALLDLDKVSVDGDNLVGFKEQLDKVKQDNGFLFESDSPKAPQSGTHVVNPNNPSDGSNDTSSIVQKIAQRMAGNK